MNGKIEKAIEDVMRDFRSKGQVFFNEAHFQDEFCLALNNKLSKNYKLTLEYSPNFNKYRVDLLIEDIRSDEKIIIEFKYVVRKQMVQIHNSNIFINLKSQGAYDVRRYQFWRDVSKIEDLIQNKKCNEGYCVLLTNAVSLIQPINPTNIDYYFDISAGCHPLKTGTLYWNHSCPKFKTGKTLGRYKNKVSISKQYNFTYTNYTHPNFSDFKYLILPIS